MSDGPVLERSDEMAPGTRCDNSNDTKKNKKRKSDDPLADLPEWLEELKENLVDTELHASAHRGLRFKTSYESGMDSILSVQNKDFA